MVHISEYTNATLIFLISTCERRSLGHDSVIAYSVCLNKQCLDEKQCLILKHLKVF